MKIIAFILVVGFLVGCTTSNPNPTATDAVYRDFIHGMKSGKSYTRDQVYGLFGSPKSVEPFGDSEHCTNATWSIPHGSHGFGGLVVIFNGDAVVNYKVPASIYFTPKDE
jgi:hypothetical protein